jgi:hypothetical protein
MIAHRVAALLVVAMEAVVALVLRAVADVHRRVAAERLLAVGGVARLLAVVEDLAAAVHRRVNPSHRNLEITVKFSIHDFLDTFV